MRPGETKESFLAAMEDYEPLLEKDLATWQDLIEAYPDRFMWGTDRGGFAGAWTYDPDVGQLLVEYSRAFIGRLDPDVQEKFAYELDAPIEVKPWFELFGPRFEGQRRLRELRSV